MNESLFRIDAPTEQDLVNFDRDGYIAYPDVMTDQGRQGLIDEMITREQVVEFLTMTEAERLQVKTPHRGNVNRLNAHGVHVRPWNNRGPWGFEMFDAPLVKALLLATVGPGVHVNHTTLHLTLRGERPIPLHHDMEPPNLEDRYKWFVFMLYYPNGFGLGDHNLMVIPGSHRIDDWGEHQPYGPCAVPGRGEFHKDCDMAELLNELYGDQVQRKLEVFELELPPGTPRQHGVYQRQNLITVSAPSRRMRPISSDSSAIAPSRKPTPRVKTSRRFRRSGSRTPTHGGGSCLTGRRLMRVPDRVSGHFDLRSQG